MIKQERLNQSFVNYSVSEGTLNELDLLENYHDFLRQHYKEYRLTEANFLSQTYLPKVDWPFSDQDKNNIDELDELVNETMPDMLNQLSPIGTYFGCHPGDGSDMGFWEIINPEDALQQFEDVKPLPHEYKEGTSCHLAAMNLLAKSSIFTKLMFVKDNRACSELHGKSLDDLDELCKSIINKLHYVRIINSYNKASACNEYDVAEVIASDHNLTNWVINNLFIDEFKKTVDRQTGSVPITSLWEEIVEESINVDGIDQDDVPLRETCEFCKDVDDFIEFKNNQVNDDCVCSDYSELMNVWIITDKEFYEELMNVGAMVYSTNSLYLYLQTHNNHYFDTFLRKAWVRYCYASYIWELTRLPNGELG